MANRNKGLDLIALEVDYRMGLATLRALEVKYKISKARIGQLAEQHGWERDLSARVATKTAAKLDKKLAAKQATKSTPPPIQARALAIKDRIDMVATLQAELLSTHRSDLTKYQGLCNRLTDEFHMQGMCAADLAQIGELLAMVETQSSEQPDMQSVQKRLNAFYKLLDLSARADTFKRLVEAKTKLVMLERLSHGIRDTYAPPPIMDPSGVTDEVAALTALVESFKHG